MADNSVDKRLEPFDIALASAEDADINLELDDEVDFELLGEEVQDDGSVIIDFGPDGIPTEEVEDHTSNLAEYLGEAELTGMTSELIPAYKADRETREP